VAQRLVLTQRAVEKHINSIFAKLGLTGDDSVDRRVKAVLMFLEDSAIRRGEAPCRARPIYLEPIRRIAFVAQMSDF
jgi:hypothetical protein